MTTIYGYLRDFGHRFLPGLIEPYRRARIHLQRLGHIRGQLADLRRMRRHEYGMQGEYTADANDLQPLYSEPPKSPAIRGVIFMCDGRMHHGGNTDRFRGILSLYAEAKKRGLPFHIFWNYPFPLEDYLQPAGSVDWRIRKEEISYCRDEAYPVVIMETEDPQSAWFNRRSFCSVLKNPAMQTHVYSNSLTANKDYAELYRELFVPTPALQQEIDRHAGAMGGGYYSYSFRFLNLLGDFADYSMATLSDRDAEELIDRCIEELKTLLKDKPRGYHALVTADSQRFLRRVAQISDDIYVVPGGVQNVDLVASENKAAWMKTFVDQNLIMGAERVYLLRTGGMYKSGFAQFAALVGGHPYIDHKF